MNKIKKIIAVILTAATLPLSGCASNNNSSESGNKIKIAYLPDFDMAEHLDSDEAIAQYLSIVLEENDPAELAHALGTIARARGMTEVARASGLTREALYKALRPTSQPRFDTIMKVINSLGLKISVQPAAHA